MKNLLFILLYHGRSAFRLLLGLSIAAPCGYVIFLELFGHSPRALIALIFFRAGLLVLPLGFLLDWLVRFQYDQLLRRLAPPGATLWLRNV